MPVTIKSIDIESLRPKRTLNQRMWVGDKLDIFARRALLRITKYFLESFDVSDFQIDDVVITGSMANYNWDEDASDIDLHIIVNFTDVDENKELVKAFFDELKDNWNSKHSGIEVCGHPVEVYVQDSNERHSSSGVYSIIDDKWLIEPSIEKMDADINDKEIEEISKDFMNKIDNLEERILLAEEGIGDENIDDILEDSKSLYKEIKNERSSEVDSDRFEMSTGNLVFKVLRRNGYIGKLLDIKTKAYDLSLSDERFSL